MNGIETATSHTADAAARPGLQPAPLLSVRNLRTELPTRAGPLVAVDNISFDVTAGEVFAIVGESGSGKSMTAMSVMGLAPRGAAVTGQVRFEGQDLLQLPERRLRQMRGNDLAMVFQDPMTSLNPVFSVGHQIAEGLRIHHDVGRRDAWGEAVAALERVGIPSAAERASDYPHQFSGGMRQRVMIAMATICSPRLLIADEPTTALDVTIQAQILEMLVELRETAGTSVVIISHDLGVVAGVSDRVAVMYAGQFHETGSTDDVFRGPLGPYTWGLLGSIPTLGRTTGEELVSIPGLPPSLVTPPDGCRFAPRCDHAVAACTEVEVGLDQHVAGHAIRCVRVAEPDWIVHRPPGLPGDVQVRVGRRTPTDTGADGAGQTPLLRVVDLVRHFDVRTGSLMSRNPEVVRAVDGVSFDIEAGETLGLVGESGCGKSTLARVVARLIPATSGQVQFDGNDVGGATRQDLKAYRRAVQMVFQDPYSSLNPRMTIEDILLEPLRVHGLHQPAERATKVREIMDVVGLDPDHARRYPHMFSGGQRQRVGIARALVLQPRLVVLDEPVSALDVSVQAQILNLLADLQREFRLSYLFISHDLSVVRHVAERVAVMYLGQFVEVGHRTSLYRRPSHPYTQALLSAVPMADPVHERGRLRILIDGDPPSPIRPPTACRFHPRCNKAQERCSVETPLLRRRPSSGTDAASSCHFAEAKVDLT